MNGEIKKGSMVRILAQGTAPSRYVGSIVKVDSVDRGTMVDGVVYRVWDDEDKIYYSFDEGQVELADGDMIEGTENCPFCGSDTDFKVADGVWVVPCSYCGCPQLLCDKCFTVNGNNRNCRKCPHQEELDRAIAEWQKTMKGQIVYWKDPDGDKCSDYKRVKGFREDCYVLEGLDGEGETEAEYYEVERIPKERQAEILAGRQ